MSLVKDLKESLSVKYPDFKISKVEATSHHNVLRLSKGDIHYIAKSIWSDVEDPEDEKRAKRAFDTEVAILKKLPSFWNIKYVDSFISSTGLNRIIITTELPSCSWKSLKSENYDKIAKDILRQIKWLHTNNIVHGDLELKNILLSCNQNTATIIDFEKSKRGPSATSKGKENDIQLLLDAIEYNNLQSFHKKMSEILKTNKVNNPKKRKTRKNLKI